MARAPRKVRSPAIAPAASEPAQKHPNQTAAEFFAALAQANGYPRAKAAHTLAVGGKPVRHGWVVNIHDDVSEVGICCVWYGRKHFQCYSEFHGAMAEAEDMSAAFLNFLGERRKAHEETEGPQDDE